MMADHRLQNLGALHGERFTRIPASTRGGPHGSVPYVSGGSTWLNWLTERGHEPAYNVAVGMILCGTGHQGVRLELRDAIRPGESFTIHGVTTDLSPTRHWWSLNIGVALH
jgi:hypothetical protein